MKRRRMPSLSPPSSSSPSSLRLAVTAALALLVSPSAATSYVHSGNGTAFYHSDISKAGCGFMSWPTIANTHYAAALTSVSTSKRSTNSTKKSACGRCARVWCADNRCGAYSSNSSLVYIIEDQSVDDGVWGSRAQDLNLAPSAFKTITGYSSGRVGIRWRFTDCPVDPPANTYEDSPAPCTICVKNDSSPYWVALQPVNDTLGIEQVEVNGAQAELKPSSSYFFTLTDPRGRLNLKKLEISITTRSRRKFKKVVAVQPGACVGIDLTDEQQPSDVGNISSDGSGSSSSSLTPSSTTSSPYVPVPSSSTLTPSTTTPRTYSPPGTVKPHPSSSRPTPMPQTSSPQITSRPSTTSPQPNTSIAPTPSSSGDSDEVPVASITPKPSTQGSRTQTPPVAPSAPTSPSSAGSSSIKPDQPPQQPPASSADASTAASPSPSASAPRQPASDAKQPPGSSANTVTPIASKASDFPGASPASIPAIQTTDIPSGGTGSGPANLDKNRHPTQDPAAAAPGSQSSGVTTTRPLVSPSPPSDSGGGNNSQPPKPTPALGPATTLTRGVLTSPLFIGLLLGSVGLVGAIVAYRAKSRQQHLLAMAPPVTSANATPRHTSRAAYTSDPGLSAL